MNTLMIDLAENGYTISAQPGIPLIEGIHDWQVACELHDKLSREHEPSDSSEERFSIEMVENGYVIFDQHDHNPLIEGVQDWELAWELHEMLTGEYDA
jgi:hypothetical protein